MVKRLFGLVLTVSLIGSLVFAWTERQNIYDWWRLRSYSPPQSIQKIVQRTTMSEEGQKIFYSNTPLIADAEEFNQACGKKTTIVLGCYIQNDKIYIYNVTDTRLDGIVDVTAAHEMLHAVYDRLSDSERQRIDALLTATYASITDERVIRNIDVYKRQDPSVVPNELHSIIATEVKTLPQELEEYYSEYFKDRTKILNLLSNYASEFDRRESSSKVIIRQIEQYQSSISSKQAEIEKEQANLTQARQNLEAGSGGLSAQQYNQQVSEFNRQVNSYNKLVSETQNEIDKHNKLVEQLKSLQVEITDLYDTIDSRPQKL